MLGETISHYVILRTLGSGGMGVVYEAEDTRLKRRVALKFLPLELTRDEEAKQRFVLEAQAASALDQPNVCTIYEIDQTKDGQLFIVMARYDGQTLKGRLAQEKLSVPAALDIAIQVASGLARAHESGIVHRDIKPANLMLTSRGEVKILDFGVAKLSDQTSLTRTGAAVGTVAYMAPEQVVGGAVDQHADVWALGVVLYEMLAGKHPFDVPHPLIPDAILNKAHVPIAKVQQEVPVELARIVERALEKRAASRYASAGELLADLVQCRNQLTMISQNTVAASGKTGGRRLAVIAAVVVLLASATYAVSSMVGASRVRWAREEALPEIKRLMDQDNNMAAFDLAVEAERYIPSDTALQEIFSTVSVTTPIITNPDGVDIYYKEYSSGKEWRYVGKSPVQNVRLPRAAIRWKLEKPGYVELEQAGLEPRPYIDTISTLTPSSDPLSSMILVPRFKRALQLTGFNSADQFVLPSFRIDRREVTNREFKEFRDAGGYENKDYWTQPFIEAGRVLTREEGMARFRDPSGSPGPSTWELGDYPKGQADYPVGGVSWYEAEAYAKFRGKSLPTVYHWSHAGLTGVQSILSSPIVKASNFDGRGSLPVATRSAVGWFGTEDMAGNVREWCWNESGDHRWILGGAWSDPSYMFYNAYSAPAFDRSPQNGFRLVQYLEGEPEARFMQPLKASRIDYRNAKPGSNEAFEVYRKFYTPIGTALNAKSEGLDSSPEHWTIERVTFDSGYLKERTTIYLFIPKGALPPYEPVLYFPDSSAFYNIKSSKGLQPEQLDFVVRSKRVLVWPIYKGSFERQDGFQQLSGGEHLRARREHMSYWREDIARTIDYLQTRTDIIDSSHVAFIGHSLGASNPIPILAVEPRITSAVLISGGFPFVDLPGEADPLNFLSRIKMPVRMIFGTTDYLFPFETSQEPFFNLIGTERARKDYRRLVGGHGITQIPRGETIRATLEWLDRY